MKFNFHHRKPYTYDRMQTFALIHLVNTLGIFNSIFLLKYTVACLHVLVLLVYIRLPYNDTHLQDTSDVLKQVIGYRKDSIAFRHKDSTITSYTRQVIFTLKSSFHTKSKMSYKFLVDVFAISRNFRESVDVFKIYATRGGDHVLAYSVLLYRSGTCDTNPILSVQ